MKIRDLDAKNKKLIQLLQQDGRNSLTDLGHNLNLSHVSVQKRLKKLIGDKQIHISANLSTSKLELHYAIILVEVNNYEQLKNIMEKFGKCPRLVFFGTMTGAYNIISVIAAETQDTLQSVINVCSVRNEPGLRRSDVFIVDIPLNPQFVPLQIPIKNENTKTSCSRSCDVCERYNEGKCAGCPGTKWYNLE
ncbi:MAG TPA: AsnC family transcriptional regulator [Candidatus Deferrimicrobium sp.]|nr:AsnC family transcriptional regulator [Candidatus Deferrimicrobium sp.]